MGLEKDKNDVNVRIDLFVHYDPPDATILKELKELKLLINKNHLKIMATQKDIDEGLDFLAAGDAAQLALSQKIDADIIKLENAINNGLDGAAIMAKIQTLKASSLALTAALKSTDDKTPEDSAPAKFTAGTDLYVDADGNLTDDSTDSTIVFIQGDAYPVVSSEPLALTGADGKPYDISDYLDSFTAV